MFTWWKRQSDQHRSTPSRSYRPTLETLEGRELLAVSVNIGPVVNISSAVGNQREQSIVVNPRNSNQIVAFSNSATAGGIFEAYSHDGGVTWNQQEIFNFPAPDDACCDPQAAWDRFGNLFVVYVTTPASGGNNVVVGLSTDAGVSFTPYFVTTVAGAYDQPSIAVGKGPKPGLGSVWVSYNATVAANFATPYIETSVAVVADFGIIGAFKNPVPVPGSDLVVGNFGDIVVGPNGEAMVTYGNSVGVGDGPTVIYTNLDPDGMGPQTWGPRRVAAVSNVGPFRGPGNPPNVMFPAQTNNFGIDAEPSLAWDKSNGPYRGRVYLAYTDAPSTGDMDIDTNIFVRYSDNRGLTWSAPVRVNNDTGGASQFNNSIAVDPSTGFVAVGWYDTRNDSSNVRAEFFVAVSGNGGKSFGRNYVVSSGPSQSSLADVPPIVGRPLGFGDYNKIDFVNGILQPVWADNSATLPNNPDPTRTELATARIRVGKAFAVKVLFPARWSVIDAVNGVYRGAITIISNSSLRGPFLLKIKVPDPSVTFLQPTNTQVGRTVTFTINANLTKFVPLRFVAELSNPLALPLPSSLIGYVSRVV
jgi:hypothetical protein